MLNVLNLFRFTEFNYKYSIFDILGKTTQLAIIDDLNKNSLIIELIAYCLMPTHIHLLIKQIAENGISKYLSRTLNSYTRYFNIKHHRSGPLWEGRFKSVLVKGDEQLLHLTRYMHLNPTSANLVKSPQDWPFSSYHEYIDDVEDQNRLCNFKELISCSPSQYRKFTEDQKSYQQELSLIKNLMIENYTG